MLDPLVGLAMSVHVQPGVYAMLLGSGVSTGAGVPTGWGVVQALLRDAAAAAAPNDDSAPAAAAADPEAWWLEHGDGRPLGYSNLLGGLAPTSGARRALLSRFFEPSDEDLEEQRKVPGVAHRAIAELVRRGSVRVIVTTNFDRLTERALEDIGISPQVISNADAVAGMTPLQHARCSMIKLHGDYADLDQRNTVDELSTYPPAFDDLLDRVLDEHGLIISGWSADWDHALVAALERARRRRYPLYWTSFGNYSEPARRLIAQHQAVEIRGVTADAVFGDLVARLDALDRLSDPPLTKAMAISRLKRLLPDPPRHIEVHDLVVDETRRVVERVAARPQVPSKLDAEHFQEAHDQLRSDVDTLLHLLVNGVYFDRDRSHTDVWVLVITRLMATRRITTGPYDARWDALQHYPALLALRAAGLAALLAGREDVLLRLLTEPRWRDPQGGRDPAPAVDVLHDYRVLDADVINSFPRYGSKWHFPRSHLLRDELRESLVTLEPNDDAYERLVSRYEYRVALVQHRLADSAFYRPAPGEFIGEWQWTPEDALVWEKDFRETADRGAWGWTPEVSEQFELAVDSLRETLERMRRFG